MIRLKRLTLSRGVKRLLDEADASIAPGERIALVGPNGSGKSSLLAAIVGDVVPDGGEIDLPTMRIVLLEQRVPASDVPAWEFVEAADHALRDARRAESRAQSSGDGMAIAASHDLLEAASAASSRARVKELLAGLGFSEAMTEQPVESLSGGWRMRLNLARALFVPSDLLLLDEPTNHLDLDAIVWFERWLTRYPGTVIAVSHDRDFLDRIAQATLSIEAGKLVRYAGGYSAYEARRAERQAQAVRAQAAQRARIDHLTAFIDRFRAKATKARQVQSRIKALERLAAVATVRAERGIDFELPEAGDSPDPLIVAEGLAAGYGGQPVLEDVELTLSRDARIGVLGRNGAGKSTLIRTLVGDLEPIAGECRRSRSLRVGYFAQHGIDALRADDSPLSHFQRLAPQAKESALRDELGRFGFSGEDALRPIGPMSGGEKARLVLASIVRTRPHLLVLDEPTNHLDAATRDALTEALADFDGALLLVSHDRYLLRATVDRFVLVHDGKADAFDGDLDDYLAWLQRAAPPGGGAQASRTDGAAGRGDRREERRAAAQRRQQLGELLKPIDARLKAIDANLAKGSKRLRAIESELADPLVYRDGQRAVELARERAALSRSHDELETQWLELGEQREAIEREFSAQDTAQT
jgi:ATP-binding cassette subfamily F protein 3